MQKAHLLLFLALACASCTKAPNPAAPTPSPTPVARQLAPEGVFYTVQKITITSDTGVVGIPAGTRVTQLKDNGETFTVTDQETQFEVRPEQVTNDVQLAIMVIKNQGASLRSVHDSMSQTKEAAQNRTALVNKARAELEAAYQQQKNTQIAQAAPANKLDAPATPTNGGRSIWNTPDGRFTPRYIYPDGYYSYSPYGYRHYSY